MTLFLGLLLCWTVCGPAALLLEAITPVEPGKVSRGPPSVVIYGGPLGLLWAAGCWLKRRRRK